MKITAAPAVLFVALRAWLGAPRSWRRHFRCAALWAVGFGIANPFIAFGGGRTFIETSQKYSSLRALDAMPAAFHHIFFNANWLWDVQPNNGFFSWALCGPAALVYAPLLVVAVRHRHISMAFGGAAVAAIALLSLNTTFYGWYWFPALLLLPELLRHLRAEQRGVRLIVMTLVLTNLIIQTPTIFFNIRMKKYFDIDLAQKAHIQQALDHALSAIETPHTIANLVDLSMNLNFDAANHHGHAVKQVISPGELSSFACSQLAYSRLCGTTLLAVGRRFRLHPSIGDDLHFVASVFPNVVSKTKICSATYFDIYLLSHDC